MNIYVISKHRRPFLYGTTNTEIETARAMGFEVDLFRHPGGQSEWAICLRRHDDPCVLTDWQPVWMDVVTTNVEPSISVALQKRASNPAC